jgi:predicted DNA-binding transcriptional regulator YafY
MDDWTPRRRRIVLDRYLSIGRKVVAAKLAKEWGCAERTIRRDLQRMHDVEKLPVKYDPNEQVWRYTKPVVSIEPTLISEEDRRALLFSLQASSQLENTPVCEQTRRLYKAFLATLPPERVTQFEQMMECVRFTGPRLPTIKPDIWTVLLLCLEAHETMRMTYTGGYSGITSDRDVDPYGLIMRDRHWILVAYCHQMKEVLTFSLYRIANASGTDRPFKPRAQFMEGYLAYAFDGVVSTGEKMKVVLRIRKDAPLFIADRIWSDNESRTRDRQGRTLVTFQTTAVFAVEREVRAADGWIELLKPAESRKQLRATCQAIAAAHR